MIICYHFRFIGYNLKSVLKTINRRCMGEKEGLGRRECSTTASEFYGHSGSDIVQTFASKPFELTLVTLIHVLYMYCD